MTAGRDALRVALLDAIARCLGLDPAEADPAEVDDLMSYLLPEVERYAAEQVAAALDALQLIARGGCHVYVGNTRCSDPAVKRIRGDRRLSSGWCDACIAADALAGAAAVLAAPDGAKEGQ